ncbi:MAG: DUF6382 domain-containing protein, partial [Eubacteriales bacterium]|nr:DUF6382 domain-containing protein [Eubacteriales bacterium]
MLIHFISMEGQIEESAGRRKFHLLTESKIPDYEKRMLSESHCPYILPMYFISEDGVEAAYYDFTGYLQSGDYIRRNTSCAGRENRKQVCDALDLLYETLARIKGM